MNLNLKPNLELKLKRNLEPSMNLSGCLNISLQIGVCRLEFLFADWSLQSAVCSLFVAAMMLSLILICSAE